MKTSRVPSKTGSSAAIEPAPRLSSKEQTQAPASMESFRADLGANNS